MVDSGALVAFGALDEGAYEDKEDLLDEESLTHVMKHETKKILTLGALDEGALVAFGAYEDRKDLLEEES